MGRTATNDRSFVSVVTIGEIERGIARQRATDPDFAAALATWLDRVLALYGERVLPLDLQIARRWGQLSAALGNDSADLMISATALEHGLTVVTRNVSDFSPQVSQLLIRSVRSRLGSANRSSCAISTTAASCASTRRHRQSGRLRSSAWSRSRAVPCSCRPPVCGFSPSTAPGEGHIWRCVTVRRPASP